MFGIIGLLFLCFVPGFLISSIFYKKLTLVERVVYSFMISVSLMIFLIFLLNIVFRIEFNILFLILLFSISTIPFLIKTKLKKPEINRGLRSFIERYKAKRAFVINLSLEKEVKINNTKIFFLLPYRLKNELKINP